jgi:hypothetical protein
MTAVFAPSGNMVACGGMDNMLTLYDLNNRDSQGIAKMVREVAGYEVIKEYEIQPSTGMSSSRVWMRSNRTWMR